MNYTPEDIYRFAPVLGAPVKVVTSKYSYNGVISGVTTDQFLIEVNEGGNAWENHDDCEVLKEIKS